MKHHKLICGRKPALEWIRSESTLAKIEVAYLTDSFPGKLKDKFINKLGRSRVKILDRSEIEKLSAGQHHQGIILKLIPGADAEDRPGDWKELFAKNRGPVVLLDRIQDPHNLGSIIRSAEAFGATGVIITGNGARPGPTVDRVSAGATAHIPVFIVPGVDNVLQEAREAGMWICVSSAPEDLEEKWSRLETEKNPGKHSGVHIYTDDLEELPEVEDLVLVIGTEGEGAKPLIIKRSDFYLSIPLHGKTSSLNAGVAAAVLLDRIVNR